MGKLELAPSSTELTMNDHFAPFEKQALEWKEKAELIKVTDESQTDLILQSKEGLKIIKQIDKEIDSKHQELKEESLRTGQLLDSIKRKLKKLTEPIKTHFEENVKFVEIQEQKRKDALYEERLALLEPLIGDQAKFMQLGEMEQSVFDAVLVGQRTMAKEKADNEEKQRLEDEKLRVERQRWSARVNLITPFGLMWNQDKQAYINEEFIITMAEIKTDSDDKFSFKCLAITNEISKRREKQLKEKQRADKKLAEEKQLRLDAEAKLKEQKDAEAKKAADARKLKRATDKIKLQSLAEQIKLLPLPDLKEDDSKSVLRNVQVLLAKVVKYIDEQTESL